MKYLVLILMLLSVKGTFSQVTNIVILNEKETSRLTKIISSGGNARNLYDSITGEAEVAMARQPLPVEKMNFEGLLDTDPRRIETVKSFDDINAVATLIYAGYGPEPNQYGEKIKQFVLAWANTFRPIGNPINENKLTAFLWGYHLYKGHFTNAEKETVENWIHQIAIVQMNRERTPNNNWEAKRLKLIGIAGAVLRDSLLLEYAIEGFKKYISTAYFPDGTSNDLRTRDALHYHISGIKPCLAAFINLSEFDVRFNLFNWESENGSSIRKAVEYTLPYALGEKQRKEWTNSKVELDRKRAEAGLEEYQPGMLFNPEKAWELFEWACYYNEDWFNVFERQANHKYTSRWIGLLNSPLVREK